MWVYIFYSNGTTQICIILLCTYFFDTFMLHSELQEELKQCSPDGVIIQI